MFACVRMYMRNTDIYANVCLEFAGRHFDIQIWCGRLGLSSLGCNVTFDCSRAKCIYIYMCMLHSPFTNTLMPPTWTAQNEQDVSPMSTMNTNAVSINHAPSYLIQRSSASDFPHRATTHANRLISPPPPVTLLLHTLLWTAPPIDTPHQLSPGGKSLNGYGEPGAACPRVGAACALPSVPCATPAGSCAASSPR